MHKLKKQHSFNRAGQIQPGVRLCAAASFYRSGRTAADIGCDHGKLAGFLAQQPHCPQVIATDAREKPLARAKNLVAKHRLQHKVDCRLGWGLKPLVPHEAQDIIIGGLSGETMVAILEQASWVQSDEVRLILIPTGRLPLLRRWLAENGFSLTDETPLLENRRAYTVLCADYTGKKETPSPLFCEVGLLKKGDMASRRLVQSRLNDIQKQLNAPLDEPQRRTLQNLEREVEAWLQ